MKNNKNIRGFSLVELSVALVILGFVTYTAMAIFTERSAIDKVAVTERRLDEIEKAIRIYYLENDDLPCLYPGTVALEDSRFGYGTEPSPDTATCDFNSLNVSGGRGGGVPVRTLNLPDSYAFDGWGNRMIYIVSTSCVDSTDWGGCAGSLTIEDSSGNEIIDSAVYALISHGKNGWGAWGRNGGADSRKYDANMNALEQENAHVAADGSNNSYDATFVDSYINDTSNVAAANYFDDIVRWKKKEMIDYDADRLP